MRLKEIVIIFLTIIFAVSIVIGFNPSAPNGQAVERVKYQNLSVDVGIPPGGESEVTFDFDEPETFEEMKSDLIAVGCDTFITFPGAGARPPIEGLTYSDALKLVRKANWVGFMKVESGSYALGFIFYLDGDYWVWAKNIPQYTRFEKIEVTSAYCKSRNTTSSTQYWGAIGDLYWEITLDFRNTGTTESSIINAFVNSKAIADYGATGSYDYILAYEDTTSATAGDELDFDADEKVVVRPGEKGKLVLFVKQSAGAAYSFTSGTTVEVAIHSGAGNAYMKMVTLT